MVGDYKLFVGYLKELYSEEKELYYSDNFKNFYYDKEKTKPLNKNDLERWAICLNSPWSYMTETYEISFNCNDSLIPKNGDERYKCEYIVIGYEGVESCVVGYGATEVNALNNCLNKYKYIQNEYNEKDISF